MKSVKARKVGSSTVLTVPKEIKTQYTDYDVFAGTDGAIVYLPKTKNPFTDAKFIEAHRHALSDQDFLETELLDNEF